MIVLLEYIRKFLRDLPHTLNSVLSRYQKHYIIYHQGLIRTNNSMGSSEIWDKYHECCIGNLPFPTQQEWYLSQISLLPMLFPVNTILAAYTHAVH